MLVYAYHPETGEYLGASEADESPNDPGEYLIPGHATTIEPPALVGGGHALAWDGSAWIEVEDHRGETWWKADGSEMIVQQIGDPRQHGLLAEQPPPPPEPEVGKLRFVLTLNDVVVQIIEFECPAQWQLAEGYRMLVDADSRAAIGALFPVEWGK